MDDSETATTFLRTLAQARNRTDAEAWPEAIPLWEAVVAANPVQGRFWSALATARYETGDFAGAISAFEEALALGDGMPAETVYQLARCHAGLGDRDQALDHLDRALAIGYRDLERARTDRAFASLRDDPRYRTIVALIDTDGLSRDEGWRTDLRFLVREIRRRAYDPFRSVSEADFEAAVAEIDRRIPDLTDIQVLVEFERLLGSLGDGHVWIAPDPDDERWRPGLPLMFFLFAEGLFIIAAAPEHRDLLGVEVLRFDGRSVDEVMAALDPLLPRDSDNRVRVWQLLPGRMRDLPVLHALGLLDDPGRVTLAIRGLDGVEREITVDADPRWPGARTEERFPYPSGWSYFPETLPGPLPLYLRNLWVPYWFTYLPAEQVVYFQFNSVRNSPEEGFERFCERLFAFISEQPVDRLVIDIRWNSGGNTLLEIQLLQRIIASKINRYGRFFVIIGRGTFSAAQNGAGMFDRYTNAIFVGEPTGSSPIFIGESVPFHLPYSNAEANVSDLLWHTTWPMDHRPWIAPTLYTPPTFASFRANRDPALEAVLAWREHLPGREYLPIG